MAEPGASLYLYGMDAPKQSLEDLLAEFRSHSLDDVEFAQRVAIACCLLIERNLDPVAAIRVVFRLQ